MKRTSKRVMAVAVSLAMVLTGSTSALAATTNPEISDREIEHKTAAKNIAAQGMVDSGKQEQFPADLQRKRN